MTYAIRNPRIKNIITIAGNDWGAFFEEYLRNKELKNTTDANMTGQLYQDCQIRKGRYTQRNCRSRNRKTGFSIFLEKKCSSSVKQKYIDYLRAG